ncbi:MAG: N-acetylmuramic acid 6-phosphate etherase [Ignavibacteria bacterium]|nr:N-acetylmuramic acid 6-phosphate etherase [Ignavibacteria bacterium]
MTLFEQLQALTTEQVNLETLDIDGLDTAGVVERLYSQELSVAAAVGEVRSEVATVVEETVKAIRAGGSLIYVGAGTSGRIGVVDASEMPPTFGTAPSTVMAVMAGGDKAMFQAVEGAEDSREGGAEAMQQVLDRVPAKCVVVGLSASGRTPFVLGALEYAQNAGHFTALVSTNPSTVVWGHAPFVGQLICVDVGPEPIAGSTRMKSGTAQKLVLNMISTATMVRLGKTYGNVMVDLKLTNNKLRERAKKIIMTITDCTYDEATALLVAANDHVKTAIVMQKRGCSEPEAERLLDICNGFVRQAISHSL